MSPAGIGIVSQLAEKAGVEDVEEFVQDAAKVKKLVDENTPEIQTFTTKGRIYNKDTNEPAAGVEVKTSISFVSNGFRN